MYTLPAIMRGLVPSASLIAEFTARPTTDMVGEIDILPPGGSDFSCPAIAHNPTHRASGEAFGKYANEKFGAHRTVAAALLCGHEAQYMFATDPSLPLLFPAPQ